MAWIGMRLSQLKHRPKRSTGQNICFSDKKLMLKTCVHKTVGGEVNYKKNQKITELKITYRLPTVGGS